MGGDYTRMTFKPQQNHSGVLMQQGRVQLDADWNELVEIFERRWRAETVDIMGRAAVPANSPGGFEIKYVANQFVIGRGRMYVDGLLAENHGIDPQEVELVWGEEHGSNDMPFAKQPYVLTQLADPGPGRHLVYAIVFERELTLLEEPDMVERALGFDTTTRAQTVWQVRVLPNIAANVDCKTKDEQFPDWATLKQPSGGRLTTAGKGQQAPDDPCFISPNGGYRGLENRLYRLEIHDGGDMASATFKWSRDNGSVVARVLSIQDASTQPKLKVDRLGRDAILRFSPGDWVEVTDDYRELEGLPGLMAQIAPNGINQADDQITLQSSIATAPQIDTNLHARIRRWDQRSDVTANGVIKASKAATGYELENGVQVTLALDANEGPFRPGDYWVFAARTADSSVEILKSAPPRGVRRHYTKLAILDSSQPKPIDCRILWPPEPPDTGCDCSACVTAKSHADGTLTIQMAIDKVKPLGGKVCLGPGMYKLDAPLVIDGAKSLRLTGRGWNTIIVNATGRPALTVQKSWGITVEELTIVATEQGIAASGVVVTNSIDVTVQRCRISETASLFGAGTMQVDKPLLAATTAVRPLGWTAVGLGGLAIGVVIRENLLAGELGVGFYPADTGSDSKPYLLTGGLYVENNAILATSAGVALLVPTGTDSAAVFFGDTRIAGNSIFGGYTAGIATFGRVVGSSSWGSTGGFSAAMAASPTFTTGSRIDVARNLLVAAGHGIVVGTDETRVVDNDITGTTARTDSDGILLAMLPHTRGMLADCEVVGNRVRGVGGNGVAAGGTDLGYVGLRNAMIKNNTISRTGGGGVVLAERAMAETVTIENNDLSEIAPDWNEASGAISAIAVWISANAEIVGNRIRGVATTAAQNVTRSGIRLLAANSARIAGNEVTSVGPDDDFAGRASGIEVLGAYERLDILDNVVRRYEYWAGALPAPNADWKAVFIGPLPKRPDPEKHMFGSATGRTRMRTTSARTGAAARTAGESFVRSVGDRFLIAELELIPLQIGKGILGIRGNLLESHTDNYGNWISTSGTCDFSDNRCVVSSDQSPAIVAAQVGKLILNANYFEAPAGVLGWDGQVQGGPFTVLGNISTGTLQPNNVPLGAPWAALNK